MAGRTRKARVNTLPETRSDMIKVQPFPSGRGVSLPIDRPASSAAPAFGPESAPFSRRAASPDPVLARHRPVDDRRPALRSVRPASGKDPWPDGADAASSCVPPEFRLAPSWPRSAMGRSAVGTPGGLALAGDRTKAAMCRPARIDRARWASGRDLPAGPKPAFPFCPLPPGGSAARPRQ